MTLVTVAIEGMHCGGCVKRVEEGLRKVGVRAERVSIGEAVVEVSGAEDEGKVVGMLEKMGFEARVKGNVQ